MAARACERARERAHERREEDRGTVSWRGTPVREWEEARGVGRLENHSLQQLERTSLHSVLPCASDAARRPGSCDATTN